MDGRTREEYVLKLANKDKGRDQFSGFIRKKEGIGLIYYCKCMRIADFMR